MPRHERSRPAIASSSGTGRRPMELRTDLDIEYVRSVSLKPDLRILANTISALIAKRSD